MSSSPQRVAPDAIVTDESIPLTTEESMDTSIPWSERRRLLAPASAIATGFSTGWDIHSVEEQRKQAQRKERFGTTAPDILPTHLQETESDAIIPIEQAWDKYDWVGRIFRVDPPPYLWRYPPPIIQPEDHRTDPAVFPEDVPRGDATAVLEKIHVCSIDWVAFKQIRSSDITHYFVAYGPTYVEWLNDLSCNIHFADQYSASRALQNLTIEIPSPPPLLSLRKDYKNRIKVPDIEMERPDLGRMGWRIAKIALRKVKTDKYGQNGTTARLLMRAATSLDMLQERPQQWPVPPTTFSTREVLHPSSDVRPPGKTDSHMPLSSGVIDSKRKHKKKRREQGGAEEEEEEEDAPITASEPPPRGPIRRRRRSHRVSKIDPPPPPSTEQWLTAGLTATRAGFSVEEMEMERAAKRTKS